MAIGLREIAPLGSIGAYILTEDAEVVAEAQQLVEVFDGIIHPAHAGQCIHIPEGAYEECGIGKAKIIVMFIAVEEPMIGQQFLFQFGDMELCFFRALIDIAHGDHTEGTGIQVGCANGLWIYFSFFIV